MESSMFSMPTIKRHGLAIFSVVVGLAFIVLLILPDSGSSKSVLPAASLNQIDAASVSTSSNMAVLSRQPACDLLPTDTNQITGNFQSGSYSDQSCTWYGTTQAVGVVILAESTSGSSMIPAYQAQRVSSENWVAHHPYWAETISPLVGYTNVYEIISRRDNSLALVGINRTLGLVMRVTADVNSPSNLLVLEEAFPGDQIRIGAN
jgi:hypothetical protein